MTDPIMQALQEVDAEGDHDDPGQGDPQLGEEEEARPEGPLPDLEDEADQEDAGFSVLSWAKSVPEGSHTDFDKSDWWDPENGGETRLAFHLSDAAGEGVGYPNGLGVIVSVAEIYWSEVKGTRSSSSDDDDGATVDADPGDTVARDDAEAYV